MTPEPTRAPRMSPEDRREHILEAATPLLIEHGADVTTRQIADAAGVAEGTIFRAFADKDELLDAAFARFMDPEPVFAAVEAIPLDAPLEEKVARTVDIFRDRTSGIVGMIGALGHRAHARQGGGTGYAERARATAERLFATDADRLRLEPLRAVMFLRMLAHAASVRPFVEHGEISTAEIVDVFLHGALGAAGPEPAPEEV